MRRATWVRLNRLRKQRRVQNVMTLGLVALGPVLAFATFAALGPLNEGASSTGLRLILLADLVYVLAVAALVLMRVARMIADRRARSAGSRLHLRLTGVFTLVALTPTVLVAVFAVLTVNFGLEGWFSERVRQVVGTSLAAAEAYKDEHRRDLVADTDALADYLDRARQTAAFLDDGEVRQVLTQGQAQVQRGLREAYVIDGGATIKARGERSYLFDYDAPAPARLASAANGETVVIEDWGQNEFRALKRLTGFTDRYLYVTRAVDGSILRLLDETQSTVRLYQQLEKERGRLLFEFGLLYLGFAVILILAAIWFALWFAERLARPIGRLAGAAQQVGAGDLDMQVREDGGDDEIAMLGRMFNQMTRQLKGQRSALLESHRQTETRRRLFDSVLTSVTAGLVGLDSEGCIDFVNRAGLRLLDPAGAEPGTPIARAVPEFAALVSRLRATGVDVAQEEIRLSRGGRMENLLVRVAVRRTEAGALEGYVVAFDDVTELVSAQRMAAWGDVARRIAHEIKNPLTPIALSAERIKRKFRHLAGPEAESLEQLTDVIVRQTNGLRRIVDEFSKFARMPEPERRPNDLAALLRDAVLLQEEALPGVALVPDIPEPPLILEIDPAMISQALTNLIKNAGEAIQSLRETGAPEGYAGRIEVRLARQGDQAVVRIADNGIGLPEDRARLFEPYVTTRETGTGLGLPIVKKIIEEHGGTLTLTDAPGGQGALAEMRLPITREPPRRAVRRTAPATTAST